MNRHLAIATAVLGLAAGAVGCSSSTHQTAAGASSSAAASTAAGTAAAGSSADEACNATAAKLASQAMSPEKDAMNQTLSSAGASVKITDLTTDSSCFMVLKTDAKPGDAQAAQAFKPLEQGFGESLTSSSMIKGFKITAADGSVIYQAAASK